AASRLEVLLPGEGAVPGSVAGKGGTASAQTAGVKFNATVRATDAYWNLTASAGGNVGVTSNDSFATLPGNQPLTSGSTVFAIPLVTAGARTLTFTEAGATLASTGAVVTVNA